MAIDYQSCSVIGVIREAPEVVPFSGGGKVARATIIQQSESWDKDARGFRADEVEVPVEAWNSRKENLADSVEAIPVGSRVFCEFAMKTERWTHRDTGKPAKKLVFSVKKIYTMGNGGGSSDSVLGQVPATATARPQAQQQQFNEFEQPPPPDARRTARTDAEKDAAAIPFSMLIASLILPFLGLMA